MGISVYNSRRYRWSTLAFEGGASDPSVVSPPRSTVKISALWVAGAALLWGMDSIVRFPAAREMNPLVVVFLEHLIGLMILLPWAWARHGQELKLWRRQDLLPLLLVGLGGGALAGVVYTESVKCIGPSSATLFLMLQPLLVVGLAYQFLKEHRGNSKFVYGAAWVIMNAVLIAFPDFNFGFRVVDDVVFLRGVLYGFLAMLLWSISTVAGKALLARYSAVMTATLRWATALGGIGVVLALRKLTGIDDGWGHLASAQVWGSLFIMGTILGAIPMVIYYKGLQRIPASLATFIELLYPVAGVFIPAVVAGVELSPIQMVGAVSLLASMSFLVMVED